MRHSGASPAQLEILIARVATLEEANEQLRSQAEELARRSAKKHEAEERFLHAIIDSLETSIVACDASGNLTLFNRATKELHGLPEADIPADEWAAYYSLYHADGVTLMARDEVPLFRALRGEMVRNAPIVVAPRGKPSRKLLSTGRAIFDGSGNKLGAVVAMHDVTEQAAAASQLRQSEEKLRQSQKMEVVGKLAGGVAHDFNNMLAAIRMNAESMLLDETDGDKKAGLREIEKAANRAAALVRQLLAFSRTQIMQVRSINPNEVIEEMKDMLQRLLMGDIELQTSLAPDLWSIEGDPAQLGQIVLNLTVNARDAMQMKGKICIATANAMAGRTFLHDDSLFAAGEFVEIRVSDTGSGMTPEVKERMFEPFFTTKDEGKGTGLGLATVFGIVTQGGGHIEIDTAEGEGTTFRVYLPRTQSPTVSEPVKATASTSLRGSETILLVDDEDLVRAVIAAGLRKSGYRVLEAASGEAALALATRESGDIDLVLTGIMMPGMNGDELFVRLAKVRPGVKVLLMSGYTNEQLAKRGLLKPMLPFIGKPFTIEDMLSKLQLLFRIHGIKPEDGSETPVGTANRY